MIYRATGNLRAVQILLVHTKIENTARYLGVDVEDALMIDERTQIWSSMRLSGIARRPLAVDGLGLGGDGNWVVSCH